MHCMNHKLELAVLDACSKDKSVQLLENTLKGVFSFYQFSPKSTELKAVVKELEVNLADVAKLNR